MKKMKTQKAKYEISNPFWTTKNTLITKNYQLYECNKFNFFL
jgi:hypothetical protein